MAGAPTRTRYRLIRGLVLHTAANILLAVTLSSAFPVGIALAVSNGLTEESVSSSARAWVLQHGESAYNHYCAPCHGETGAGDGRYFSMELDALPISFADSSRMASRSLESVQTVIHGGSAAIGRTPLCPPWGANVSDRTAEALARFVMRFHKAQPVEAGVDTLEGRIEGPLPANGRTRTPVGLFAYPVILIVLGLYLRRAGVKERVRMAGDR